MFKNRQQAGQLLANKLKEFPKSQKAVVFAIPRGGVIVAKKISDMLSLPIKLIIVKKLSSPGNPELAIGAITYQGIKIIDWDMALRIGVGQDYLDQEIKYKQKEIEEREKRYGIQNSEFRIQNKNIIILVDDGVATGATVLAAVKYIKFLQSKTKDHRLKIILAVPVIAKDSYNKIKSQVNEVVALEVSESFSAVGQFYKEFPQVEDEEVIKILASSN